MKLPGTTDFAAAAFPLSLAPLGAAVVFSDTFSGNPEESLADYNANYTIYADVAQVPEPATYALMLGMTALGSIL